MPKKEIKPLKGKTLANKIAEAWRDGYINGLKDSAKLINEAEILIKWIRSTPHSERIDFVIDQEIEDYFHNKETKKQ